MDNREKYAHNALAYDKIVESWHDFRKNCKINKCIEEFVSYLNYGSEVLDAGCGTGYPISDYLTKRGFKVTGIDPSEKMLEKALSLNLNDAEFIKSEFLSFSPTKTFDAIIAFDCLWYIAPENQPDIYKKAAELIKSGGYFMFTHGATHGEIQGEMFGENFFYSALSLKEVKSLLSQNGFDIVRIETNYSEPTTGTRDLLVFAKKR